MSSPEAPDLDALTQLFAQNPPKDALQMRAMLEGISGLLNADPPEVGAFHEAVLVREAGGAGAREHRPHGRVPAQARLR